MEMGSTAGEEECTRCKEVSTNSVAFFCPTCGRQIKSAPEGKFAFRAAEGSAEKAWKSFGFADAHAPSKRAKAAVIGNDSAKRAASLALAVTRSNIERTIAPPTLEQARVMGVESVVEGVDWKLSTKQLQVLALARSGALRGRRRVSPSALPQPSPATPKTAASANPAAPNCRVAKAKPRDESTNLRKSEPSVDQACIGNEEQELGISTQRSSARRGSDEPPKRHPPAAEVSAPTKQGANSSKTTSPGAACAPSSCAPRSFPAVSKRQRHQLEVVEETQEQLVAVARGGVRYAGKVFHRRGVKLTEDSPRSMIPRDAFRASGLHLLGRKELSMGRDGHRRILVAELSALVRAVPNDSEKAVGLAEDTAACLSSQPPCGAPLAESSFACHGVRLEMRPLRLCCQALIGECALDALQTTCLEHANQVSGGIAKIDAAAAGSITAFRDESRGSGSSGGALEERKPRRGVEEDGTADAGELFPQVPSSLPTTSTTGLADLQYDCSAASAGGRCDHRGVPVVFSQDFTHAELDALLGPTLSWKDPFEENRNTVGGLKASWTTCLDSLCRRLRATVPEADVCGEGADGGRPLGGGQGVISPGDACGRRAVVAEKLGAFPGSTDGSRGKADAPQPRQCVDEERLAGSADDERQGSPPVPVAAGNAAKTGHPAGRAAAASDGETRGRAAQAPPLVRRRRRRRKAGGNLEEDAGEGVWFDKAILRVGARVPWGRLHRGRFAKVLFTVNLGKDGNGLEFAATSISPTADPMLRGIWHFRATDRDLARYLSSRYAAFNGADPRVKPHAYDPRRCTAELQERGELEWACAVIARTAFRLVLAVPARVVLSLAGVAIVGGREVAWPQDIEEDRMLYKASTDIQRAWRGCTGRRRARWLRMEREGRRRLSRMRKEAEDERERTRFREEEAKAKLTFEEERRKSAQIVLASATRGQAARRETSRRRAEETARQRQLDLEAAAEQEGAEKAAAEAAVAAEAATAAARSSLSRRDEGSDEAHETAASEPRVDDHHGGSATPGVARLERVVTIDGTEVHLTAHVKQAAVDGGGGENDQPSEMLLMAVDKKARRSSRLSLDAADIGEIVGAHQGGGNDGGSVKKGAQGALSAVLQKLTLFNSRRKDLFILSYRGKKVALV